MATKSIKIRKELYQRMEQCSAAGGYSSAEEFIEHILEREIAKLGDAESDEEIVRKMRGLGYID
jgi:metal-responsive CopG/Arc/MetJ family transcriptional regulator